MPRLKDLLAEDLIGFVLSVILIGFIAYDSPLNLYHDWVRKRDLKILQEALEAYAKMNGGIYQVPGTGFNGSGQGWISITYNGIYTGQGPSQIPSTVSVLHSKGLLKVSDLDDPVTQPGYLLFLCDAGKRYSLSAKLDWPPTAPVLADLGYCNGKGPNGFIDGYKRNYAVGN